MSLRLVRATIVGAVLAPVAAIALAAQQPQQGPPLPPNGWRIDPGHSAVTFRVRHLGMTWVNGKFGSWTGALVFDSANPEAATVEAHIQAASVNTENERRDNDVRQNYFQVDSFPEITFVSRRVERAGEGCLRVTGDLTIHGVTKSVVLETEIAGQMNGQRGKRMAFTATTTISRREFGILRNGMMEGVAVVGDEIRITIDIEAVQPNG